MISAGKKDSDKPDRKQKKAHGDPLPLRLSIAVGIIAMAVYLLTLSPGVSWAHHSEDSGDLITSAWLLGIPHPTGYPLFCILGWLWSHIIPFGTVAWRMNAFSAIWSAMAAGITVRAVWASFDLLPGNVFVRLTRFGRAVAAMSSGLILAFATDVWSLSIVTEVYSLNLFFVSLISWILIELLIGAGEKKDEDHPKRTGNWPARRAKLISLLGLLWGLALTNHLTSIFLFPGILLVLIFGNLKLNFREVLKGAGWFAVALLLYLYLPIRSLMEPPLDWGDPENFPNFVWVVTGQQFKKLMFALLPYQMLHQIVRYSSIPGELGGIGALAAGLGVCRLLLGCNRGVILLLIHTLMLVASGLFYLANYYIWDPEGYLLPMIWAASLWAGWSLVLLISMPENFLKAARTIAIVLLIIAPIAGLVGHWKDVDLSGTRDAIQFGEESFGNFEKDALVLEVRYERAFTLWYYREIEYADTRDDVAVVFIEHATFDWGLDLFRRKYPDLILPETPLTGGEKDAATAAWIIENNIDKRPVYCGATVDELMEKGYRFQGVGLMFRVFPPEI